MAKRILLDVDGVIADFTSAYLEIANKLAGTDWKHDDQTDWNLGFLPGLAAVENEAWKAVGLPGFARRIKAYDGAIDGVRRLAELGDIYIVTSPVWMHGLAEGETQEAHELHGRTFCYDRVRWLEEHFGLARNHIIFAYDKHLVEGDVFIDDKPSNVENWLSSHGGKSGTRAILWARKYNEGFDGCHPKLLRTGDWNEAISFIQGFGGKR
jgi:5'(3')-deoxyribonucleotidase